MLDLKSKQSDPVAEVRQVQQEKKQEILGSIQPHKGHIIFEVNLEEKTIAHATFEDQGILHITEKKPKSETMRGMVLRTFKDGTKKLGIDLPAGDHKKILRKKNCIYIPALNKKNVLKKLVKKGIIQIVKK